MLRIPALYQEWPCFTSSPEALWAPVAKIEEVKNELSDKSREYRNKSSVATRKLEALFDQADDLLKNRLYNLMKIFVNRDPNFYNGYEEARMNVAIRSKFYPPPGEGLRGCFGNR